MHALTEDCLTRWACLPELLRLGWRVVPPWSWSDGYSPTVWLALGDQEPHRSLDLLADNLLQDRAREEVLIPTGQGG